MFYVLVLFCAHIGASCQQPETALAFEATDQKGCQRMADQFNSDPINKAAGATERCLQTMYAYIGQPGH